jgi:hypothetical protein
MIHSIDDRKSSVLGTEDWCTIPWRYFAKDSLQQLYDIGFEVATHLEQLDLFDGNVDIMATMAIDAFSLLDKLDRWYIENWSSRQLLKLDLSASGNNTPEQGSPRETIGFEDITEASNMLYYWWFQLVLNKTLPSLSQSNLAEQSSPVGQQSPEQYADATLTEHTLQLAINIVLAAPYFLDDDTGWVGPQRLVFPLKYTMQHLGTARSPHFAEARAAFGRLLVKLKPSC